MQLRVALAQYLSGREPAEVFAQAKAAAADIIVFPEMYSNGYTRFDPDDPILGSNGVRTLTVSTATSSGNSGRRLRPTGSM